MPAYLHKPVRLEQEIASWVKDGRLEDAQLDFKANMWEDKPGTHTANVRVPAPEEFASDVASFLNHLGGDIVLGINDGGGKAAGWFPSPKATFPGKVDQLRDWLNQRIEPRDACANVEFWESSVDAQHPVLVVSVAPYRFGPVSVVRRQGQGSKRVDRLYHSFPVRDGATTRYLEMAEVARRMNPRSRATYLGAAHAQTYGRRPVRIASPVVVAAPLGHIPLDLPGDQSHAVLCSVNDEVLVLGITCTPRAAHVFANARDADLERLAEQGNRHALTQILLTKTRRPQAPGASTSLEEMASLLNTERIVPVPLDLVRALWHEPRTDGLLVHVALDVDLRWDGGYWLLASSG